MAKTNMKNQNNKSGKQQKKIQAEKAKKNQKLMGWTLLAVLAVCVILIIINALSGPAKEKSVAAEQFHLDKQPVMGSQNAPVKVVEFADFKCPACQEFDQSVMPQMKKELIDGGTVQFYFINYPIISPDADSRTAAIAGEAVYHQNPQEFWKFYEAVYAHQGDERTTWATSDTLVRIAREAGVQVDFDKLKKDIDAGTYAQDVKDDEAIVNTLGVQSTPTIFINGKEVPVNDTFDYNAIKEAVLKSKGESGK